MESAGYSPHTTAGYLRGARHLTWCIEHRRFRRSDLTLENLRAFARAPHSRCECPFPEKPTHNAFSSMKPFLRILQRRGIAPVPKPPPFASELAGFGTYLEEVRGVADETRLTRLRALAGGLTVLMPAGRFDARKLTAPPLGPWRRRPSRQEEDRLIQLLESLHGSSARQRAGDPNRLTGNWRPEPDV